MGPGGTRLRLKFDEPVFWPAPVSNVVVVRDGAGTAVPVTDFAPSAFEMTLTNPDLQDSFYLGLGAGGRTEAQDGIALRSAVVRGLDRT